MTQKQENNLSRHIAVEKFITDNISVWTLHVEFTNANTAYAAKIGAINAIVGPQGKNLLGVSLDKKQTKQQLIDLDLIVADAISSWAFTQSNNTLEQSMTYTDSKLKKNSDTVLTDTSQLIHDTANANILVLTPFGITAAVLLSMQSIIDNYGIAVPTPRNAVTNKTVLTDNLKTLFKECDTILKKRILKIGRQFKTTNPDFYKGLLANKKIIDLGKTTTIFRYIIKDADGNAIPGALVAIGALNSTSNEKGKGNIKKVPFGNQDIIISKANFQTFTISQLKFVQGNSITRTVTLLPV